MKGVVLVTGAVLLASVIYPTESGTTYHVAFLGRSPASPGSSIGRLQYQNSSDLAINASNKSGNCSWQLDNSSSSNIKQMQPLGDCGGHVPDGVALNSSGLKVESEEDGMILHVFQTDASGALSDGFLAIPDNHLGNEYYVITYCTLGGFCQFAVAGTVDGTSVNIVFPVGMLAPIVTCNRDQLPDSAPSGRPVPFTLNEFDVLHIESESDLTGTYISSDHNVSVFVGARDVPSINGLNSSMIEQIPPINKWGTDFVVAPNYLNEAGDVIKIVTESDNTWVHILGFSPFIIPNKGKSTEHRVDWKMYSSIKTSKPVLVVQVMSVDLYNDTTAVTGLPAMLLVPHIEQWSDNLVYLNCLAQAENESVITVIVYDSDESRIAWTQSTDAISKLDRIKIVGTDYSVLTNTIPEFGEENGLAGVIKSFSYGYCNGTAAFLLDAQWEWENEKCVPSIPVPGDGVDNNCNGQIDEETCTDADRDIHFTSEQTSDTGAITYKSVFVKGKEHVAFTVQSCDIAIVTLQASTDPNISYTAHILPGLVVVQVCAPDCEEIKTIEKIGANCNDTQQYEIGWKTQKKATFHGFRFGDKNVSVPISGQMIDYDVMFVYAYVGSAEFVMHLLEKDCSKILSEDADNFGKRFIVASTQDDQFDVFITNMNNHSVNVTIHIGSCEEHLEEIAAEDTYKMSKARLSRLRCETEFNQTLLLEATDEVSVYFLRRDNAGLLFSYPILPVDVLGPHYQLFLNDTIEDDTETVCTVHSIEDKAMTNAGDDPISSTFEITKQIYDNTLGHQHLLESNRPVAVFCGSPDNMAQMPPRETLGTQYYIPELNLTLMSDEDEAEIRLVATEDSTVVTIRGNYDQLDNVSLTGNGYSRHFEMNTLYDISATKPIQVYLQIRSTNQKWSSVVVIPPIEQYKKLHVFPAFQDADFKFEFEFSSAVDVSGDTVISNVSKTLDTPQNISYESPTFSLTVLKNSSMTEERFIVPSDVMYQDINQVCIRSEGVPGDGKDNDCDGLIDEEQCSNKIIPGAIDADIDGSMNEDCAVNTTASPTTPLQLSPSSVLLAQCPRKEKTSITINSGVMTDSVSHLVPDEEPSNGTEITYAHLHSNWIYIPNMPTTTQTSGPTTAPVETCLTDCVCPCGWINPTNFTKKELQALIAQHQAKLLLPKLQLSAALRAKSSAKDDRAEAIAVGYVGICFLVTMVVALFLLDLTSIVRDARMMISNIREVFQP